MSDNYFGLNKLRKWRPDTYGVEKIQLEKFQNAVITLLILISCFPPKCTENPELHAPP